MRFSVEKTRHAAGWRKKATEHFGAELTELLLEETNALYESFCNENLNEPSALREHTCKSIYPLTALYLTLK